MNLPSKYAELKRRLQIWKYDTRNTTRRFVNAKFDMELCHDVFDIYSVLCDSQWCNQGGGTSGGGGGRPPLPPPMVSKTILEKSLNPGRNLFEGRVCTCSIVMQVS